MKTSNKKIPIFAISFLLILVIYIQLNSLGVWGRPFSVVYFYNPQSNINNFSTLKIRFDTFLSSFGNYRFQPFNKQDVFEKNIRINQTAVLLLSSWNYRILKKQLNIKASLVGLSKGQSTHKMILSSKLSVDNLKSLSGKKIASSAGKHYSQQMLMRMLGSEIGNDVINHSRFVTVPKDIDALIAVSMGLVDVALTTDSSLQKLQGINPKLFEQLHIISKSNEILRFVVATIEDRQAEKNNGAILDVLKEMNTTDNGEVTLKMLGIDSWREINSDELLMLGEKG